MDRKLFACGTAPAASEEEAAKRAAAGRELWGLEARCGRMLEALGDVVGATKGNTEKKATLSLEELQASALLLRLLCLLSSGLSNPRRADPRAGAGGEGGGRRGVCGGRR